MSNSYSNMGFEHSTDIASRLRSEAGSSYTSLAQASKELYFDEVFERQLEVDYQYSLERGDWNDSSWNRTPKPQPRIEDLF